MEAWTFAESPEKAMNSQRIELLREGTFTDYRVLKRTRDSITEEVESPNTIFDWMTQQRFTLDIPEKINNRRG